MNDGLTYGIYFNITKTTAKNKQGKYLWSGICSKCGEEVFKELSAFKKQSKQCHHKKEHLLNNYVDIYMPEHHLARGNGCTYGHYLIAEEMLGRELKKGETVHHKDHNRANNTPENLMIFKTNADHSRFHKTGIAVLEGDVYISPKQETRCPHCNKVLKWKANQCLDCYNKEKGSNPKKPPKEILAKLICSESFVEIGRKYNVSDNTIRNWCKSYGLPYRKKDMPV